MILALLACLTELQTAAPQVADPPGGDTNASAADSDAGSTPDTDTDENTDTGPEVGFECAGADFPIDSDQDAVAAWKYAGVYEWNWFDHILLGWQESAVCPPVYPAGENRWLVKGEGCTDDFGFVWEGSMLLSGYNADPYFLEATFDAFRYSKGPFAWSAEGIVTASEVGSTFVLTMNLNEDRSNFHLHTPFPSWSGWRDGKLTHHLDNTSLIVAYDWEGVSVLDASETGQKGRFCWTGSGEVTGCQDQGFDVDGHLELQGARYARVDQDGDCDACVDVTIGAGDPTTVCE